MLRRVLTVAVPTSVLCFLALSWPVPSTSAAPQQTPPHATTGGAAGTKGAQTAFRGSSSVAEWSDRVWKAAKDGDLKQVEETLKSVPDSKATADVERLRGLVAERFRHAEESETTRGHDVEAAAKELDDNLAKSDIPKALTSAVKLQTLSDDWKKALERDDMKAVIAKAGTADESAQAAGDWLLSQELLFRLRTLFEDSGDRTTFKRYDEALEKVNRRIGLMAQYAPKQLYELRKKALERLGPTAKANESGAADGAAPDPSTVNPKPSDAKGTDAKDADSKIQFPEWNPAFSDDWKDQVRGITTPMLSTALKTAANEHISARGWQPLIRGGLDALALFATTDALSETFPGLKDEAKVKQFLAAVERGRAKLAEVPADKLEAADYRDILRDLLETNQKTIELPDNVLLHEFGDGALDELAGKFEDQYSEIIWPERLRRFEQQVNGDFVGVGILIRHDDKRDIIVVNPLEGSPAARGGIKADDHIVGVNGAATTGWSLNKAVDEITGPPGQPVTLSVRRPGKELPFDVTLVRDRIKIRSVNGWWKKGLDANGAPQWDYWIDRNSGIGYIRLTSFNEDSFADFRAAIDQMRSEHPLNGLVLDLRHNPGGLLKSAVEFTNAFVPSGEIVSGENRDGQQVWSIEAQPNKADLAGLPLVVLVNQGSASASEIVSGALQAHDAAVVLGERSFGKGSVQTVHDISDRTANAGIKLTTQYYILPALPGEKHGRCVHKRPGSTDWGVNPDLVVKMTPAQIEKTVELRQNADIIEEWKDEAERKPRPDPKDLLAKNLDPQLETALLILQARVLKDVDAAAVAAASR
ncbi:MAG: S41 family peptidase [Phycisphaerales bacterium]